MANGFYCKKCGEQETAHDFPEYAQNPDNVCGAFVLSASDKKKQKKIDDDKMEVGRKLAERSLWIVDMETGAMIDIGG